jgi:hypothetical protein
MNTNRIQLRQTLVNRFDLEELRTLCDDLDIDFDNLRGEGKAGKARELVLFMRRRDRLDELAAAIASFLASGSQPPDRGPAPAPAPIYHLVEIRIFDPPSQQDVYPVELKVPGGRDFPRGQLNLSQSALLALSADSEAYGRALGEALFAEQAIGRAYQETRAVFEEQGDKVRISLRLDPPALHDIRWERIYHPIAGSWQALATTADTLLSRYVPVQTWGRPDPVNHRPLRALVILASPRNLDGYSLSAISNEEREAWHAVFDDQPNVAPTYVESATGDLPTLDRIRRALMEGYHIVHLVCHGKKAQQGTALFLENANADVEPVRSERLLEMFRALSTQPHLCFLAACESGARASTDAFIPLGPALVAEGGVSAVVAMADRVGMAMARQFARQFYDRVLTHGVVDLAVHQARTMVRDQGDWSVPVLFSRLPDNQLFGTSRAPLP